MTRIFLDANILLDITYASRLFSEESSELYRFLLEHRDKYQLYTSCDRLTAVYYVLSKQMDSESVLKKLKILNRVIKVIEFGNREVDEAIYLMEKDENYKDLEDTIQYVMARKQRCDYIVTNDKTFMSYDIPLLDSTAALSLLQEHK